MLQSSSENRRPQPKLVSHNAPPRRKRSVSDIAHSLSRTRREPPRVLDLQAMVRLSGKSILYLPHEYTPGSLVLPTSLRATAQYLAQHATTRGVFRIPGSIKVVNALFDYYCTAENGGTDVANTVRCANLPMHINSSVHDVASTFKRLLSILPGGILGCLSVFDALVAIHSTLQGDPEFPRTKQTKVRARLIALALGTINSQFQRELICAVFGLLSLIGRAAEVTPREDEEGRPLPTSDLMGYGALGIVFGPLLVGDLLDQYIMKLATPTSGLLLFPLSPGKLRKDRRRSRPIENQGVDKIMVANSIAEMLISNWRDVVRQMKTLGTHNRKDASSLMARPNIRTSASEIFVLKKPTDWDMGSRRDSSTQVEPEGSPKQQRPATALKRQRSYMKRNSGTSRLRSRPSVGALSPTYEESHRKTSADNRMQTSERQRTAPTPAFLKKKTSYSALSMATLASEAEPQIPAEAISGHDRPTDRKRRERTIHGTPEVSIDEVPPRTSSKFYDWNQNDNETKHSAIVTPPGGSRQSRGADSGSIDETHEPDNSTVSQQTYPLSSQLSRDNQPSASPLSPKNTSQRNISGSLGYPLRSPSVKAALAGNTSDSRGDGGYSHLDTSFDRLSSPEHIGGIENYETPRSRVPTMSSTTSRETQTGRHETFYLSPNGNIERHVSADIPQNVSNNSIDKTPEEFYAPMRVPPSLLHTEPRAMGQEA